MIDPFTAFAAVKSAVAAGKETCERHQADRRVLRWGG
jgi:hypothetical protein